MATTETSELEQLRYPIGRFRPQPERSADERKVLIERIAALPGQLRAAVTDLTPEQLDTPYRPGGWTVRQLVHHLPDSHINSYVRFKLAVTEAEPQIKTYDETAWAELPDARDGDLEMSLALLEALHRRWTMFLRALAPEQFRRTVRHPEWGAISLDAMLQLYAWHCQHHMAHVTGLRQRMGW